MKLGEYLDPRLAAPGVRPGSLREVLAQLVAPLSETGMVEETEDLVEALAERESIQSTGVGRGIAVPHAVCEELSRPCIAIGLCPEGVEFHALDEKPVHLFFLVLSPPSETKDHIKLLARIARLTRRPELLDRLRDCREAEEAVEAIRAYEREHV